MSTERARVMMACPCARDRGRGCSETRHATRICIYMLGHGECSCGTERLCYFVLARGDRTVVYYSPPAYPGGGRVQGGQSYQKNGRA